MCGEEKCERDKIKDTKDNKRESRKKWKKYNYILYYIQCIGRNIIIYCTIYSVLEKTEKQE